MSAELSGRKAIVTGAGSGIGRAIALELARAGAEIALLGRSMSGLEETQGAIAALGGKAQAHSVDVRDDAAFANVIDAAAARMGGVSIMVNNAGLSLEAPIAANAPARWREMLDVNVQAVLVGAQAAAKLMRANTGASHIVNIGSIAGRGETAGVYGATKAAVELISSSLRVELEETPIRVTDIMPGAFLTNFGREFPAEMINGLLKAMGESFVFTQGSKIPSDVLERVQARVAPVFGDPVHVGRAVVYVVSQPPEICVSELVIRPARSDWRKALGG